jgi:hypothetical protein
MDTAPRAEWRNSMRSEEAFKQAGRDVLRFHARRIYVRAETPTSVSWIFGVSVALSMVGVAISRSVPIFVTVLACAFPFFFIGAVAWGIMTNGNAPTRKEAAENALKYNKAIHFLTHSTDPAAIGPLIEVLWLPEITAYVPLALRGLLPQLQPHHHSLLSTKQRDSLLHILTQPDSYDLELQRATVLAMGNIGDAKALPILEQLAGGALGAANSPELREDARTALFMLQERINPGYAGRNLLRASEAPIHSPDELLRPATGSSETPPKELLRAQNGP